MRNFTIKLIIFFSAFALIGMILIQTYWILRAFNISQKNFEHRVHSALSSAIDEINNTMNNKSGKSVLTNNSDSAILVLVKPLILDSLLNKYIKFYKLNKDYEFAIEKNSNDSIIYSTSGFRDNYAKEIIFRHCLSKIYKNVHYHVELLFPGSEKNILLKVGGWFLLSVIFL